MNQPNRVDEERQLLLQAQQRGPLATLAAWVRLSGPGWLQSAITLGGGSLASSLYLGVLAGVGLLWLQPLAMALGIVMLGAIGYVTLSTGQRPFRAINQYVNPVLGWSWALASLAASMVWCLPQFSLATGVLQQNLAPGLLGPDGPLGDTAAKGLIAAVILVVTVAITWSYDSGRWGIRLYELVLKLMVGLIVVCFVGVVWVLRGQLDWGEIGAGFIPDLRRIFQPAPALQPLLDQIAEPGRSYWVRQIVAAGRDTLVSAAATAVGINMTFLFPYSLLRRGWTREFRGLAIFDLATGMFIPFVLATSCVIIAAAARFHGQPVPGLVAEDRTAPSRKPSPAEQREYRSLLLERLAQDLPEEELARLKQNPAALEQRLRQLPLAERRLAATLVKRDAYALAQSLAELVGRQGAHWIFGLGVLGMTLSTITLLMLISGFVVCEMFDLPQGGWSHRLGSLLAAVGALGPFIWGKASFYLAVPTSVFGFILLPIAYLTFFFLMNQPRLLGDDMPRGFRRLVWNLLMGVAATVATVASVTMVWVKAGRWGIAAVVGLVLLALVVQVARRGRPIPPPAAPEEASS